MNKNTKLVTKIAEEIASSIEMGLLEGTSHCFMKEKVDEWPECYEDRKFYKRLAKRVVRMVNDEYN